ncbi:MAG: peptidoglycan-binding protein [Parcubacteria group bacterium]|nr:peptidoglycan-binding protein [Parcubacteria group bacterium]
MNKQIKLLVLAVLSTATVFSVSFLVAEPVLAQTNEQVIQQLQAQIEQLKAQITVLQQQLGGVTPSKSETAPSSRPTPTSISTEKSECPVFSQTLYRGVSDANTKGEVTKLQKMLAEDSTVYPEGLVTGHYGLLTEKAVQRWQAKQGIVSSGSAATGYGVVGPQTRSKMSIACPTPAPIPPKPIPAPTDNITVLSPNGGEQWAIDSNQTIQWTSKPIAVGSALAQIAYVDINLSSWSIPCKSEEINKVCPLAFPPSFSTTLARKAPNSGSFSWTVGKDIPVGQYVISISNSGNTSQYDQGDAAFTVTSPVSQPVTETPKITSLSPSLGAVGAQVTLTGASFTSTGNKIKFGNLGSEDNPNYSLNSSDGKTIIFTVPSGNYLACWNANPACLAPAYLTQPGVYGISVINTNGASNEVSFTVVP